MTAIQRKKVENLEIINNDSNIINRVEIKWTTYDDSDPEEIRREETKWFTLDTEDITTSSEGFVSFENLTEATILGWLEKRFQSARIQQFESEMIQEINDQVNPPTPPTPEYINKELPW